MDEPTAVLTPQETLEIFAVLRRLAAEGRSIIFISHKLNEVLEIADRITVIRRGHVVGSRSPADTNADDLAEMMVGRDVALEVNRGVSKPAEVFLSVDDLHARDDRGHEILRGVSFQVRSGEILGIAGVAGNGQEELVEAIAGLRRASAGRIELDGHEITRATTRERKRRGVAHVPGDRQRYGLVLSFPVADNLVLTTYYEAPFSRNGALDRSAIRASARRLIADYDIRTPSESVSASTLSGGNQQKIVVAREFGEDVRLLLLNQPTRGLDVGSIEFIHRQVVAKRDAGAAVLLVSAELDEVLQLSDRIGVIYRGRLVAVLPAAEATREQIGLLMATGQTDPDTVDQPLERVG
jgi:simple sugar transport system ATP-binding protein